MHEDAVVEVVLDYMLASAVSYAIQTTITTNKSIHIWSHGEDSRSVGLLREVSPITDTDWQRVLFHTCGWIAE